MNPENVMNKQNGFTLIEMAIVLFIVALLLGGLLPTISSQIERQRISDTRKQLDEIQQALIGFAIINGRLPCPATSISNGAELPAGGGNCSSFYNGFVPASTLGLSGSTNSTGLIVDSWGNPIYYAVTPWSSSNPPAPAAITNVFTTAVGMKSVGISYLNPTLLVCNSATATGFSSSSCGTNNALTSNGVPAIIFSTGKNGPQGNGVDEQANLVAGTHVTFVSHTPTPSPNEFDDLVIWISPNTLMNRMVAAGTLP